MCAMVRIWTAHPYYGMVRESYRPTPGSCLKIWHPVPSCNLSSLFPFPKAIDKLGRRETPNFRHTQVVSMFHIFFQLLNGLVAKTWPGHRSSRALGGTSRHQWLWIPLQRCRCLAAIAGNLWKPLAYQTSTVLTLWQDLHIRTCKRISQDGHRRTF